MSEREPAETPVTASTTEAADDGQRRSRSLPLLTRRDFERGVGALVSACTPVAAGCHDFRPACPSDAHGDPLGGYQPKFLSRSECLTLAAAAEAMLGACPAVLSAGEVARRGDELLAAIDAPAAKQAKLALFAVQALAGFSHLDLSDRRALLDKLVRAGGLPRDTTRVFKALTVAPYYSHPEARRLIGYQDFEARERFAELPSTTTIVHPEPERFG